MQYPALQVTFLGTGTSSGVPMIGCGCEVCTSANAKDKRLRASILVQAPDVTIVVDTGPDFRQQMLTYNIKRLDAVLLTHAHKDHIAGLDDVRAYNYFQQKPMQVFGSAATLNRVREEFYYAFSEKKLPGVPSILLNEEKGNMFYVQGLAIQPITVWHMYMPVWGFRFGRFTYITDANRIDDEAKEQIRGSEILVLNALRMEKHISHYTLQEAIAVADELEVPQAYFTHISHQMGLHEQVSSQLPQNRVLAYDGLVLTI